MSTHLTIARLAACLLLSLIWQIASTSFAGTILGPLVADYTLSLSSKELVLERPGDPDAKLIASWDHAYERVAARNTPWIELMNNPDSTSAITRFELTIGDEDFHFSKEQFGAFIMESSTDSPGVSMSATTADGGDVLILDIVGLLPGDKARFRIDLAPDDPARFPHPDFRRVLFDFNGNDDTDNARATVRFADFPFPLSQPLRDFAVPGPIFFENHLRPAKTMEPVLVFSLGDRAVIPEPSSFASAGLAILGLTASGRRRPRN